MWVQILHYSLMVFLLKFWNTPDIVVGSVYENSPNSVWPNGDGGSCLAVEIESYIWTFAHLLFGCFCEGGARRRWVLVIVDVSVHL